MGRKHGNRRLNEESKLISKIIERLPYNLMSKLIREGLTLYGRVDIVINLDKPVLIEAKIDLRDVKTALGQLLFYATCFANPVLFICCKEEIPEKYLLIMHKYGIRDWLTEGEKYLSLL